MNIGGAGAAFTVTVVDAKGGFGITVCRQGRDRGSRRGARQDS